MKPSLVLALASRMIGPNAVVLAATLPVLSAAPKAQEPVHGRPSLLLENQVARLVVDIGGGSMGEFRLIGSELNPLSWSDPKPGDTSIHGFGHFLCLDRWGPPSEAEEAKGMPYHGEAANVAWHLAQQASLQGGAIQAQMSATLPKAGLAVRRTIRLSQDQAVFAVREEITNENALGRIYNVVQHPTIAPPFLDESTVVDCSGRKGFAQGGSLPNPEEPSYYWPQALDGDGQTVSMRRLTNSATPNVVSYTMDGIYGWVTAATPAKGLLLGYLWKTKDYPWVSLWRDVKNGRPAARGLEFGTTGLHQPFAILVQKGRIWDRPLFDYLDSGETAVKQYVAFLLKIPADFVGVQSVDVSQGRLILHERGGAKPRTFQIQAAGLIPD